MPEADRPDLLLDDFVVFYSAGKHVTDIGGEVYQPATIAALQAGETGQAAADVAVLPFFNPPAVLLPLSLLGLLALGPAAAIWLTGSAMLAVTSLRALTPRPAASSEGVLLMTLGVLSSLPLYQMVVHGQMTLLLVAGFALFGAGIIRPERGLYALAGLLLLAVKPVFLPLPLLYLALKRRFRLLLAFAVSEVLLVAAAAALFDPELPLDYVTMSLRALSWDEVNGISTYGMFGWTGFWRGVLGPGEHSLQMALTMVSALASLAAFGLVFARDDRPRLALAAIVTISLLISPHSYAQDLLLLVLPILMLGQEMRGSHLPHVIALLAWFAAFIHFDTLAISGLGAANLALIALATCILAAAAPMRLRRPSARPLAVPRAAPMDIVLTSADAAGS